MKFGSRNRETPYTAGRFALELLGNALSTIAFGVGVYFSLQFSSLIPAFAGIVMAVFFIWLADRLQKSSVKSEIKGAKKVAVPK